MQPKRLERQAAIAQAAKLVELLNPAFLRLEVAGALRRGMDTVKDIDLVGIGAFGARSVGLFDDTEAVNLVTERVDQLLQDGTLSKRVDDKGQTHMGEKSMRMVFDGMPVDLYVTYDAMNYGLLKVIRTGPYLFAKRIVTPVYMAGLLNSKYVVKEGWIRPRKDQDERVPTPEEEDVFEFLTIGYCEPNKRVDHAFANRPRAASKSRRSNT